MVGCRSSCRVSFVVWSFVCWMCRMLLPCILGRRDPNASVGPADQPLLPFQARPEMTQKMQTTSLPARPRENAHASADLDRHPQRKIVGSPSGPRLAGDHRTGPRLDPHGPLPGKRDPTTVSGLLLRSGCRASWVVGRCEPVGRRRRGLWRACTAGMRWASRCRMRGRSGVFGGDIGRMTCGRTLG